MDPHRHENNLHNLNAPPPPLFRRNPPPPPLFRRNPPPPPLVRRNPPPPPQVRRNPLAQPQVRRNPPTQPQVRRNPPTQPQVRRNPPAQPQVRCNPPAQPQVKRNPSAQPQVKRNPPAQPQVKRNPPTQPQVKRNPPPPPVRKYMDGKPTVKVYCKANPEYVMTVRADQVVLARSNPSDLNQLWIKFGTNKKDEQGHVSFALVNKATGKAMKHPLIVLFAELFSEVRLTKYDPDTIDESVLWTEGDDLGDGYRAVRKVNNIKHHLGVHGSTKIVLGEWKNGSKQRWTMVPY